MSGNTKNTGYCVKCRQKDRKMVDGAEKRSANGRLMFQGTCETCGTKMTKFIKDPLAGQSKKTPAKNAKKTPAKQKKKVEKKERESESSEENSEQSEVSSESN